MQAGAASAAWTGGCMTHLQLEDIMLHQLPLPCSNGVLQCPCHTASLQLQRLYALLQPL